MNWFRQNRFLGAFLVALGLATIAALIFLWSARSRFDDAQTHFSESASELSRLQRLSPFPTEANLQKMKTHEQEYGAELAKLKEDLKTRALPVPPMAPNEFQTRLNQARATFTEKAKANKVKLPENFFLGFEEFGGALPDTAAAPLLGQELAQLEGLLNILIDARVDAITSLRRVPLAERAVPTPTPLPNAKPKPASATAAAPLVERNVIDVAFAASPGALRRILNQIATADQQFYVMRTLHILNEKEKGPPREGAPGAAATPAPAANAAAANSALNFILGNEHVQAAARVEMLRFTF